MRKRSYAKLKRYSHLALARPWARAQGPGPGPFAKLLNEFVSQRSYFLLASLNYLMNLFPRRSYFLLADFIDMLSIFPYNMALTPIG